MDPHYRLGVARKKYEDAVKARNEAETKELQAKAEYLEALQKACEADRI
jgi:hypothetical protein